MINTSFSTEKKSQKLFVSEYLELQTLLLGTHINEYALVAWQISLCAQLTFFSKLFPWNKWQENNLEQLEIQIFF